ADLRDRRAPNRAGDPADLPRDDDQIRRVAGRVGRARLHADGVRAGHARSGRPSAPHRGRLPVVPRYEIQLTLTNVSFPAASRVIQKASTVVVFVALIIVGLKWRTLTTNAQAAPPRTPNLVVDSGFEQGIAGFYAQSAGDSVIRSTTRPIAGAASLVASIKGYG